MDKVSTNKQTNKHIHTSPPSLTPIQSGLLQGAQSDEGSREEEGEEEESDDDDLVEEELRRQDEVGDPLRTIPQAEIEAELTRQAPPDITTRKQRVRSQHQLIGWIDAELEQQRGGGGATSWTRSQRRRYYILKAKIGRRNLSVRKLEEKREVLVGRLRVEVTRLRAADKRQRQRDDQESERRMGPAGLYAHHKGM